MHFTNTFAHVFSEPAQTTSKIPTEGPIW